MQGSMQLKRCRSSPTMMLHLWITHRNYKYKYQHFCKYNHIEIYYPNRRKFQKITNSDYETTQQLQATKKIISRISNFESHASITYNRIWVTRNGFLIFPGCKELISSVLELHIRHNYWQTKEKSLDLAPASFFYRVCLQSSADSS